MVVVVVGSTNQYADAHVYRSRLSTRAKGDNCEEEEEEEEEQQLPVEQEEAGKWEVGVEVVKMKVLGRSPQLGSSSFWWCYYYLYVCSWSFFRLAAASSSSSCTSL